MIYLDNNATTQIHPEVLAAIQPWLGEKYGNPSSTHLLGQESRQAVEQARYEVAALLKCHISEVIFTSGGTEADNAAILGTLAARPDKKTIITSTVEHSAVREPLQALAASGYHIIEVPVDERGHLNTVALAEHLANPDVALLSLMWANNETGVIFDIQAIGTLAASHRVPFHTDAVQAVGKIPIAFASLPVDMLSVSAHKFHGPKGVGALLVKRRTPWQPLLRGGPQERDRRGGTENVPAIVGMGAAARRAAASLAAPEYTVQIATLRDRLEQGILSQVPDTSVNGDRLERVANTTNISFTGLEAQAILILLSQHEICVSAGAACSSGSLEPSHVLRAMRIPEPQAHGAVRFSLSTFTTPAEVDQVINILPPLISRLRSVLPTS